LSRTTRSKAKAPPLFEQLHPRHPRV